jgi:hypothetical protein
MRKLLILLVFVLVVGCAGIKVDTGAVTDCMLSCLNDTIWVSKDGVLVPVVPGDYDELIYQPKEGILELKGEPK